MLDFNFDYMSYEFLGIILVFLFAIIVFFYVKLSYSKPITTNSNDQNVYKCSGNICHV